MAGIVPLSLQLALEERFSLANVVEQTKQMGIVVTAECVSPSLRGLSNAEGVSFERLPIRLRPAFERVSIIH